jgi:hypothetical protein
LPRNDGCKAHARSRDRSPPRHPRLRRRLGRRPDPLDPAAAAYLYDEGFEGSWIGPWSSISYRGDTDQGRGLRTRIHAGSHYGANMSLRLRDVAGTEPTAVYYRYFLRFGSNWAPRTTGKLPGLSDLNGTSRCKGGYPPTASSPCWSARMMWRPVDGGTDIGVYTYHLDQDGIYGDGDMYRAEGYTPLVNNRWYCVEGFVEMNRPGAADGIIRGWINGKPALERSNLRFRDTDRLRVERLWYDIYYGAKPTAPQTMDVYVDRVALSTRRIGCSPRPDDPMWEPGAENEPFKDMPPGSFAHAQAIDLLERGITSGCRGAPNPMFCPRAPVTRSQMAAFFARALKLPATGVDYFDDDAGSIFEDAHNRLAASGITSGCGDRRYCGDDALTRGQMAAFLTRAFKLPASSTDYFGDDDSSIFERAINALAASGITRGCNPPDNDEFCPDDTVTRAQMAVFLIRALDR